MKYLWKIFFVDMVYQIKEVPINSFKNFCFKYLFNFINFFFCIFWVGFSPFFCKCGGSQWLCGVFFFFLTLNHPWMDSINHTWSWYSFFYRIQIKVLLYKIKAFVVHSSLRLNKDHVIFLNPFNNFTYTSPLPQTIKMAWPNVIKTKTINNTSPLKTVIPNVISWHRLSSWHGTMWS